jgi:hypothetical protein
MKLILLLSGVFLLTISAQKCSPKKSTGTTYKGRLEIKAICMNYTLSVIEGKIDTSLVVPNWTDENTGKSYINAFALGDPCSFPASIKQGDEFYFRIDTAKRGDCAVCMAYYPTPQKKLLIKIVENR